ncbi:MAG: hypothetical protein ACRC5M_04900 [Anaeroplasmataceae bacterium]
MAKTIVDIIPTISPTGEFKKITDDDTFNNNNKVATLFNVLEYVEGKNSIFPNMGVYRLLNKIPYSDEPEAIVGAISSKLSNFLNFSVDVDYEYEDENREILIIKITIVGLKGSIKIGTKKSNGRIKLLNPKYIK